MTALSQTPKSIVSTKRPQSVGKMRTKRYEIKKLTPHKNKHFSSTNHIETNIKTASLLGLHREFEKKSELLVRVGKSPIAFDGRSTSVQPN